MQPLWCIFPNQVDNSALDNSNSDKAMDKSCTGVLLVSLFWEINKVLFLYTGEPRPVTNSWKYSTKGLFSSGTCANLGMSGKTW